MLRAWPALDAAAGSDPAVLPPEEIIERAAVLQLERRQLARAIAAEVADQLREPIELLVRLAVRQ